MKKKTERFYYIDGQVFKEKNYRLSLFKAKKYAIEKGISEEEIYCLKNDKELDFLKVLLERRKDEIKNIRSQVKIELIQSFLNANNERIPSYEIELSFVCNDGDRKRYAIVVDSPYEIDKALINTKILFDYLFAPKGYLEIYYFEDGNFKIWHIGDREIYINQRKEQHQRMLAQRKVVRDRAKYERLLRLRSEGKITEKQSQELYRLDKVFGGKSNGTRN